MRVEVKDPAVAQAFDELSGIPGWIATVVFDAVQDEIRAGDTARESTVQIGQVAEVASGLIALSRADVMGPSESGSFCAATVRWERTTYLIQRLSAALFGVVVLDRAHKNIALAMHHAGKLVAVAHLL